MLVTIATVPLVLLLRSAHRAPAPAKQGQGAVEAALD